MAALFLSLGGAAAGQALFGSAAAATALQIAGAVAGNLIDHALLGGSDTRHAEGPRLTDLDVMASTEGAPIARIYGRARIAGQMIWATQLQEVITKRTDHAGGKAFGGGGGSIERTVYSYFANFAVGLCEGQIGRVARVWADGKLLDLTGVTMRVHKGSESQAADPLIVAKEGADDAPAYRGLAYVVFERLPLERFGNRIPQLSFEVIRPIGRLEKMVRAVTLIPGATEFGYEPSAVVRITGTGQYEPENRHVAHEASDVEAALDDLMAACPNLERVAIVVAWFGTDLRAGLCQIKPGVDSHTKLTHPVSWSAAGLERASAHLVSTVDGHAAYGGTPSDASVINLIGELKARGLKVTLYPFVMMDIPEDNGLEDPWTGADDQPSYPWRGRITCDPAPGRPGSPDGSAAAATQINALFGTAAPADFAVVDGAVTYSGPDEWTLRRQVLHCASLCLAVGGVDAFLIGSELRGLTRVRSAPGAYPAVTQLVDLAADVKAMLGSETIVSYGADWTEYGAHVVDAAANEVRFPLDPLWSSAAIDVVGIDYYPPLADWRDSADHLDLALAASPHDRAYLKANLRRGEGYDWFYPDDDARAAQERSPITDGLGKPWVFRVKDLWNWWSTTHYERVGGAELGSPTGWLPQGKPIWLTELGCPAVDKGANQPSTFPDPKSSEGGVPYFSNGRRDDLMQRRFLESVLGAFDPAFGANSDDNPQSPAYSGHMVDPSTISLWTWDARPYPIFPAASDVWGDHGNWETGHWLTGRLGAAPLDALIGEIIDDAGIEGVDTAALNETVDGYVIDRPMAPRAAIETLALAYAFDASEAGDKLEFRPRGGTVVAELSEDDLILPEDHPPARLVRAQETELPREISIAFTDAALDYRRSAATSRRLVGGSARTSHAELAVVTSDAAAERRADIWLQDIWAGRERADFALPPSALALTPGDLVGLTIGGRRRVVELRTVIDAGGRAVRAQSIDPGVFDRPLAAVRWRGPKLPVSVGPVHVQLLDLPTLPGEESSVLLRAAVSASPWPGPVAVWRSFDGLSFERIGTALAPAIMGETLDDLGAGPAHRWDHGNRVRVKLYRGALSSRSDRQVLAGANVAAVRHLSGAWEVLQFANAELVATRTYELSRLLRGQAGSEWTIEAPLPAGAPFVVLDEHLVPVATALTRWTGR